MTSRIVFILVLGALFELSNHAVKADEEYYSQEYYEDDVEEGPTDVWGYLLNEAAKQAGLKSEPASAPAADAQEISTSSDSAAATSLSSSGFLEKLFVGPESLSDDPVYNWILGFSAIALFFHAFYTPYGKTTITKFTGRRRRRSEVSSNLAGNSNPETEIGSG
jgi:hypothetical protein